MAVNDPILRQQLDLLYREHHGWLSTFLRKRMGCSQGAADLAQDTYLRILTTGLPHGVEQPRGFLARIARGLVIDRYRRKRIETAYLEQIALYPQDQVPSPETRLLVIETLIELDRLLDELPGKVRQAFLLHRLDGLSYREIAEHLGVSVSSVEKYIARGLQACLLASLEGDA